LRKNLEFRRSMVGRTLSAAILDRDNSGITSNYLNVTLASPRPSRTLADVTIGGITTAGLHEAGALPVL
jgi:hypothetical protein